MDGVSKMDRAVELAEEAALCAAKASEGGSATLAIRASILMAQAISQAGVSGINPHCQHSKHGGLDRLRNG